ncbi:MAG: hypothetical protein QXH96_00195 [Candidatus Geothermarchaeota archaeon]
MFKAVLSKDKIKRWIKFITTINKLTDESCIWIRNDALHFRDMDAARICMIDFKLLPSYFAEFECKEEIPLCVQSKMLLEFSKHMKNVDEMEMTISNDLSYLILQSRVPYERSLMIPVTVDRERSMPGVPELEYTASVKLVSSVLKDMLTEAKSISDRITFIAEGNSITFLCKNEEGFQVKHRLVYPENLEILDIHVSQRSTAVYMVKPLLEVVKELSTLSRVSMLDFGNMMPLHLSFELIEGESYEFFLAPRTEE